MNNNQPEIELFLKQLKNSIVSKKLAIFVGAGISKNSPSNLPLAHEIRDIAVNNIFNTSDLPEKVTSKLVGEKVDGLVYPFEAFIQVLVDNSNFLNVLQRIFSLGTPNKTHFLIGNLITNFVQNVMTTNFDEKIEQAIYEIKNLQSSSKFQLNVFFNESQFSKLNLKVNENSNIIKIHGSINDDESIRTTLDNIVRRDLLESRVKLLQNFFVNLNCDILIMGYSCSDDFDINPVVRNFNSENKIFFVKHSTGVARSQAVLLDLPDPFRKFSGNTIQIDTDELVDILLGELFDKEMENEKNESSWSTVMIDWFKNVVEPQRAFIAGHLLYNLQEYRLAEKYFKKNVEYAKEKQDPYRIACTYEELSKLFEASTDFQSAENYANKAYSLFQGNGAKEDIARILFQLGRISQQQNDVVNAKSYYEQSLALYSNERKKREIGNLKYQLSTLEENPSISERLVKESIESFRKFGDILGLALGYFQLGFIFIMKGDLCEAEKQTISAKQIYDSLGHKEGVADCLFQIGSIKQMSGSLKEAKKHTEDALIVFKEIGKKNGIGACLFQIEQINKKLN